RVYAPVIAYQSVAVVGGNNNGIFNRGETVDIVVTLKNQGGADAENVTANLLVTHPHITLLDGQGSFGTILPGNTANNSSDPFTVCSDTLIIPGTMVQFKVAVNYSFYSDTFQFSLPVEIYLANFDDNNGNFTPLPATGGWEWGVPTSGPNAAHSPPKLWATILAGNYGVDNADWRLTSPELTASCDTPQLRFWHWYSFEGTSTLYDGGNVKISTNNGQTWTVITPVGGYTGAASSGNSALSGQPIYGGSSNGWVEAVFNLPVLSGQRFYLRWHFGTDGSVNSYPGWYVDDVTGIGFAVMPPPNNDVGVEAILSPGPYHFPNTQMIPIALIKNYGALAQNNFAVVCSIVNHSGVLRYTDTQIISVAAGDTYRVNFTGWTPTETEVCTVKVRTLLAGDEVPGNDRKTRITAISPTTYVTIGTGTTNQRTEPLDRYYNYNTHEVIYLQSEIGVAGSINALAYQKASGSDLNPITPVDIYMCHTTESSLASGSVTIPPPAPYVLVYSGPFPNDVTAGWLEVTLTTPFNYNNTDNLKILIVKGYQSWISSGYPYWNYTTTSPTYRTRGSRSDTQQPTSLTATYNRPNIRFLMTTSVPGIGNEQTANRVLVTTLYAPKPNPMRSGLANITYSLAEPTKVSLKIYDATGRVVRTLVNGQYQQPNVYTLIWDGKDDNHQQVAEGIYFYTLETSKQKFTKKAIYTR
ncbi:MAG: FlgD immunoglobulin-like domain containing protein, partial [candidate division WOR-3 bacterium]